MSLAPLVSAFGAVLVGELGDKTQIVVITLAMRYRTMPIFAGAMLALLFVDGISIAAGFALGEVISGIVVGLIGSAIFIGSGFYTLMHIGEKEEVRVEEKGKALIASFAMTSAMEIGDKTQFSVVALAAKYGEPLLVFLGTVLAYLIVIGISVMVGSRLFRFVSLRKLRLVSGLVFIAFGVLFLLEALV